MKTKVLLISLLTLSGCSFNPNEINGNNSSKNNSMVDESSVVASTSAHDAQSESVEIVSDFAITTEVDNGYIVENNIYKITKAGDYYLSGNLNNGQVYVEAGEVEVKLILNECKISNSTNSPIFIKEADKVVIKAESNTYNEINDLRDSSTVEANAEDETIGKGAIYAKCDLNISGSGNLVVNTSYNNGIHTTKDLKIKNVNLKSTAINNSLKGNDSVEIESGNIIAISSGGDGIKTDDSDISSKGNQRGTITISGGTIDIYAACDGIDASYDVIISDEANVNITTNKYSKYTGEVVSKSDNELYIYVPSSYYSTNYRYAIYYYNDDYSNGKWENATYYTKQDSFGGMGGGRPGGGGSNSIYYYKVNLPTGYTNLQLFRFTSSQENSLETYNATISGTINTNYDTIKISYISGSNMSAGWTMYQSQNNMGPGGMQEGNTNKTEYSAKGIKADNQINITGGNIFIKSADDGIHANNDNALENEIDPLGNVTISGGNIQVYTQDDGIHADNILSIEGGDIVVTDSYEGLEGNTIKISGGKSTIYASDDGINAAGDISTPSIQVSGGFVDVTVGSGDVDGIDSNGTYTQSGGVVITRGSSSSSSSGFGGRGGGGAMASGLDCDGKASLTGGTFISLGSTETTPQTSFCKAIYSSSIAAGEYILSELDIGFRTKYSYSGIYIYSEKLTIGNTYTITGTIEKSWTQSATSTTIK